MSAASHGVDSRTVHIERDGSTHPTVAVQRSGIVYWLIAGFKLTKGVLLLAVAVGALTLLGKDVAQQAAHLVAALSVDPDNRYVHAMLLKFTRVDDTTLEQISAGTFFYAGLLLTEGIGLLLRRRWAEYFTIFATASFIPLETYELITAFSAAKIAVLFINLGVVVYLAMRVLRRDSRAQEH